MVGGVRRVRDVAVRLAVLNDSLMSTAWAVLCW